MDKVNASELSESGTDDMPYRLERYRWVPKWVKSLGARVGRRGIILLFFGFLFATVGKGWISSPPADAANYAALLSVAPFCTWGLFQIGVGILMGVAAVCKRMDPYAFGLSAAVSSFFGLCILFLYLPGGATPNGAGPRLIVTYFLYSVFILIVSGWPERTTIVLVDREK